MMITCILPVQYDTKYSKSRQNWQSNELIINSLLIVTGTLGSIIGAITSIITCVQAGCCLDQREAYMYNPMANTSVPSTPLSMRYPVPKASRVGYAYQQPSFRMAM